MNRFLWLGAFIIGCSSDPSGPPPPMVSFPFGVDAPVGSEEYKCWAFDVASFNDAYVQAIRWDPPPSGGGVILHHATIYAAASWSQGDVSDCWDMPTDAVGMHVWAPGTSGLTLPSDMGLEWPAGTKKVVIQTHAIRTAAGPSASGSVSVDFTSGVPARKAAWLVIQAPIPALRPHMKDTSSASCVIAADVHAIFDWPHMHLAGYEFHGKVTHADGSSTPLVDVVPWLFGAQQTYPVDVPILAGETVSSECIWFNQTDQYIFGGPRTTDEMCNQAIVVWPAENATWTGSCP